MICKPWSQPASASGGPVGRPAVSVGWRCRAARRGVAIVVVLSFVAIALALSYALMRSQGATRQIQHNSNRRLLARQAALTGLAAGLRRMHETAWGGIGTATRGATDPQQSFEVVYRAGDDRLHAQHPELAELPYRVTLDVTGHAGDPLHPGVRAIHRLRAVVRLTPRELNAPPSQWDIMQQYTVYQLDQRNFALNVPCRVAGDVRVQGAVLLAESYSWSDTIRLTYLEDLNRMRADELGDYRPLTGTVYLPFSNTTSSTRSALSSQLGVTLVNISTTAKPSLPHPSSLAQYRIYAGGPSYAVPTLSGTVSGASLRADPVANPLGIYFASSSVTLQDDVTLEGTLVCRGDVVLNGTNLRLQPAGLPPLVGSSRPVRLPTIVARQRIKVGPSARVSLEGVAVAGDDFNVERGSETVRLDLQGRIIAAGLSIRRREEWHYSSGTWDTLYSLYLINRSPDSALTNYFPMWMSLFGRHPQPRIHVRPPTVEVHEHWQDLSQPIYVKHAAESGLRWELVDWEELP
jgi:hypothetical protein